MLLGNPTVGEVILAEGQSDDPVINSIMELVETMCDISVAEATGFHKLSVLVQRKTEARQAFITAMNKAAQDTGP